MSLSNLKHKRWSKYLHNHCNHYSYRHSFRWMNLMNWRVLHYLGRQYNTLLRSHPCNFLCKNHYRRWCNDYDNLPYTCHYKTLYMTFLYSS